MLGWIRRFLQDRADATLLLVSFIVCVLLGHLVVVAHTVSSGPGATTAPPQGATPYLWGLACLAVGALVGFLFGVPRTTDRATVPISVLKEAKSGSTDPQTTTPTSPAAPPAVPAPEKEKDAGHPVSGNPAAVVSPGGAPASPTPPPARQGSTETRVNTNLEQVSDWLTKIIVGVGLTQIQRVPKSVENLASTLSSELNPNSARANLGFSEALVVYFSVVGFLFAYLLTRVYLQKVFREDDNLP